MLVRLGHVFLLTILALILVMGKSGNPTVAAFRMHLADGITPVLGVISAPFDAFRDVGHNIKNWASTYQQNHILKAENTELLKWQAEAKNLQAENARLRALLNVAPPANTHFITAQIISEHGSAFSSTALVNASRENGIAKNQAVISERGLVGRVAEAGERSAQLLLLTDMNSRIPVMNERTREKMILVGKNAAAPILTYVANDSAGKKGDRIITSGDGGVFPKNIPVGVIKSVDKSAMPVDLFAKMADIEYVSVVEYGP